uniref:Uncharacterized protein n=1 Tax=Caenorhabditis japonica TaxID=281687 RepID=A0A8R1EE93_CAEJA
MSCWMQSFPTHLPPFSRYPARIYQILSTVYSSSSRSFLLRSSAPKAFPSDFCPPISTYSPIDPLSFVDRHSSLPRRVQPSPSVPIVSLRPTLLLLQIKELLFQKFRFGPVSPAVRL